MITLVAYVIVGIYCLALGVLSLYGMVQLYLLWHYRRFIRHHSGLCPPEWTGPLPVVTLQLPVYNERYVVDRLIDSVCALTYPKSHLQIQILDDSTDDTSEMVQQKVQRYQQEGFEIAVISRKSRDGYKAGALESAMSSARGDFIAIFDADFIPRCDFLNSTLPYFNNTETCAVQTRWEHLNEDFSLLTQMQAFQLNMHFTVEQTGRQAARIPLQFNGTAGIWRKSAILDAGGWQCDTLTEDLDLSYRAQLRGWKITFLEHIGSPAELPVEMPGLKSQQFRWMKGGAETARKILPLVWRSGLSFYTKVMASQHLLAGMIFIWIFLSGILSVPLLWTVGYLDLDLRYFGVFLIGMVSLILISFIANARTSWAGIPVIYQLRRWAIHLPVFLTLSMGMAFHNSVAVIQGFVGRRSGFVRTPKYAVAYGSDLSAAMQQYAASKIPSTTIVEIFLAVYFFAGILIAIDLQQRAFILYHIVLMTGYAVVGGFSIHHLRSSRR